MLSVFRRSQLEHDMSPKYGIQLVYVEHGKSGLKAAAVTTAWFNGNALMGNRSIWEIMPVTKKAVLTDLQTWTADNPQWVAIDTGKAWVKHRKALARFLMERWELGKLHGRIIDKIE